MGLIRVDNVTYTWMGAPEGPAVVDQTSFSYTSSKSIFTQDVDGKVELKVTFLSPVYPEDLRKQSLVFSYMDVEVTSKDNASHQVSLYSDVSGGKCTLPSEGLSMTNLQNGHLETAALSSNGTTARQETLHTTASIDKRSSLFQRILTRPNMASGTMVPTVPTRRHTSLAQMLMFAESSSATAVWQTRKIQTSGPSATLGQCLLLQAI
jgi:hypothetical protein